MKRIMFKRECDYMIQGVTSFVVLKNGNIIGCHGHCLVSVTLTIDEVLTMVKFDESIIFNFDYSNRLCDRIILDHDDTVKIGMNDGSIVCVKISNPLMHSLLLIPSPIQECAISVNMMIILLISDV